MKLPIWSSLSKSVRIIVASGIVASVILIIVFLGMSGDLVEFLKFLLTKGS